MPPIAQTPAAPLQTTLASLPTGTVLQRGDNDASGVWGGQHHSGRTGQPVRELQQALQALGAMSAQPDGDFGRKTQDAVRRFQWYLGRIGWRLRLAAGAGAQHGMLEPYTAPDGLLVDGFVRPGTLAALLAWRQGDYALSSPLVALSLAGLPQISLGPGFDVLDTPSAPAQAVLVHQDFADWVRALDGAAKSAGVKLRINQAFRVQGMPVSGAVVPPASNSQHLIGHALDLNIVDGTVVNTSAMLLAGTQTQAATDFIHAAKQLGLRWGGDFSPADPPHFDDFIDPAGAEYQHSFYFAQRSFHARHPVRSA